ncbi:hypothetical protein [Tropicimonas aquimaris]|uniref:Peptidase S8/S53 domain-containing protein n=1 Tax=Tropicimonas aquimaris TaxID=914152 RepID=A0ABW3INM8_9RHOB
MAVVTRWSAWRPVREPGESPYHDWWSRMERGSGHPAPAGRMHDVVPLRALLPGARGKPVDPRLRMSNALTAPTPPGTWNAGFKAHLEAQGDWLPPLERLPVVPEGTVMVGVIDADIPLGHTRLCDAAGNTRIAAAWQMGLPDGPDYLPFGHELYAADIDRYLSEYRSGPENRLDQSAFDRRTGMVNMKDRYARRALASRYSHGAHVLDVTAGCRPEGDQDPIAQTRVLAVNLPPRIAFGASGEFLDYYMVHALRRIVDLSDAIWLRNHPEPGDGPYGYPLVVNLSFGRQAGIKDRRGIFARAVRQLLELRRADYAPIDVVTPAGNDNLERMHAVASLAPGPNGAGEASELELRIQPGDQSSGYVEILFEADVEGLDPRYAPLEIDVVPPGGTSQPRRTRVNARSLWGEVAEIHCGMDPADRQDGKQLFRILVCVAPTSRPGDTGPCAPSGAWNIHLRNRGVHRLEIDLNIQTDQAILPGSTAGRRAYFDSPYYHRYNEAGRMLDTAATEPVPVNRPPGAPPGTPVVLRHSTINATASSTQVACLGGYRLNDGREAPYSSTGAGVPLPKDGRSAPTAALPTEDGAAIYGRLAAGSADGSVVAMRGTSFAAPQAVRFVALARLRGELAKSGTELLTEQASRDEAQAGFPTGRMTVKSGAGRMRSPFPEPVKRL